jgi:hypothetical protein
VCVCVCVCVCLGVNVSLSVCLRRVWVCFFVGSGCRCELSLEWPNITAMTKLGKSFSGGLGPKAARSATSHYGVWGVCARLDPRGNAQVRRWAGAAGMLPF